MELRHFRYFVAVAEELHFGRAAARLRVAQPAVSRQIRQLEEEIGARLFERSARGASLTSAGREFLRGAREVIALCERTVREVHRTAGAEVRQLSVAFAPSILQSTQAARSLERLQKRNAGARFEVLPLCSLDQWTALRVQRIQIGVLYQPPDDASLVCEPLWEVGLCAAIPGGHRLAGSATISLQQLAQEPLIWFRRSLNPRLYDAVCSAFDGQGLKMNMTHETTVESSRLALVNSGLGVTLIAAPDKRAIPGVELRPISDLREKLRIYAVHDPARSTPLVADFLAALRAGLQ